MTRSGNGESTVGGTVGQPLRATRGRPCAVWSVRGREVSTAGDSFLAMFDGPQLAIRCALSIRDAVQALGIEVRAGLHAGECEVRGDDIAGYPVHIGARVRAPAGPNDVLVSSTCATS
jgi:class 3 adenylate cyclase